MKLKFAKMHGLGNDFIVLDGVRQEIFISAEIVRQLSNRKTGIGCDQLLLVEPPILDGADFLYRIFNADGTEVSQCGNGARCIAKFVFDQRLSLSCRLMLQTKNAPLFAEILDDGQIAVELGVPDFTPERIPILGTGSPAPLYEITLASGERLTFAAVSIGNPHAVLFVDDSDSVDVETLGPAVQQSGLFPEGVNVGFCQIVNKRHIKLRVYERGVGETQACGSGACAAVAAGYKLQRLSSRVSVQLTGGELAIDWLDESIKMTGPAVTVFEGVVTLQDHSA